MSLLPCATCPWRLDKDASTIPNYVHEKACGLMKTVGDGDAFRSIMACHGSTDDNMVACKGYLARAGWSNITVRLLLAKKQIEHPDEVLRACEASGIELEENYEAVLKKLACSQ